MTRREVKVLRGKPVMALKDARAEAVAADPRALALLWGGVVGKIEFE